MEVSAEKEISQIRVGKPHVVILGAGASSAALPCGDKRGKKLPLMNNLVGTLGLDQLIASTGIRFESSNFEHIYAAIYKESSLVEIRKQLELEVRRYFSGMALPEYPTIYDYLVLSLRNKDFIATFNWDPFLVQAIRRNSHSFKMPRVLFLHGNVEVAYCPDCHMMGISCATCCHCGSLMIPTELLFPISEKNYHLDYFISRQWGMLADALKHAFMVTIFGYGAPTSDSSAIELLKNAWGGPSYRSLEQFEIIDIRQEDDLRRTWSPFIHTHHYRVECNFYDSWIANHPRRTGEAYFNQFIEAKFIENNSIPRDMDLPGLWKWYSRLQEVEDAQST